MMNGKVHYFVDGIRIQFGKGANMSNLDFLLDCTDINEVSSSICENGNTIVRGIFYGSEDLSWTAVEYIFDGVGNYISHKEIDNYR